MTALIEIRRLRKHYPVRRGLMQRTTGVIRALDGVDLNILEGECLAVVEKESTGSVWDLAIDFLVYGSLAEIFGRQAGFNRGLGGSMHVFFPPFGIYPNNAIVGGSADIATGAALFKKINAAEAAIAAFGDRTARLVVRRGRGLRVVPVATAL